MLADHRLHDVDIIRNVDLLTSKFGEVLHGFRFPVGSDDDLDILGEVFRQPEGNITFFSIIPIHEVINAFKDKNDLVVKHIKILNCLVLNPLVADIQPIGEIFSKFFLMQLHLLVDIEFLPQFDENAIDGIEVIAVISSSGGEVEDDEIIVLPGSFEGLMVFIPLDEEGLLADPAVSLDDQWLVVLGAGFHVEPLLDHEVVLLQPASRLVFIESEHDIRCTAIR